MTRKDYALLAGALASARPLHSSYAESGSLAYSLAYMGHMAQWTLDRDAIADTLAADNPRFDRARFVAATEGVK